MKKYYKDILFNSLSLVIIFLSMITIYDLFYFHTFDDDISIQRLYSSKEDIVSFNHFQVHKDYHQSNVGGGFVVLDDSLLNLDEIEFEFNFLIEDEILSFNSIITIEDGVDTYDIEYFDIDKKDVKNIVDISCNVVLEEGVTITLVENELLEVTADTKNYKLEDCFIYNDFIYVGHIELLNGDKYDNISLEYCYADESDYRTFYKIDASLDEYQSDRDYNIYYDNDIFFNEHELSVVLILMKDGYEDKYVYVDLNIEGVLYE